MKNYMFRPDILAIIRFVIFTGRETIYNWAYDDKHLMMANMSGRNM
jgi:hypothetical protein